MKNYQKIIEISNSLIKAVEERNSISMQELMDELERSYKSECGEYMDGYDSWYAFVLMQLASARYFHFNNMYALVHTRYNDVLHRMESFRKSRLFTEDQKTIMGNLFQQLEQVHKDTPVKHQNLVVNRSDSRCCLCRFMPANKTGSHMVPNFLSHPTFSWDGKGKRFREALNHEFLNHGELNCQFYGREVPEWRFAKGMGKEEITDEDIEKNVNQLEYDNEFCSHCEDRFEVLESAYSQFYNGSQRKINPRVAYLFWLSVLWRMSMGSMSIFMDMNDELLLREVLDENMLDTVEGIENSSDDLGSWKYAIFRAHGLCDGDKGIFGYRKECSPYVVVYNDLVMVFFNSEPGDEDLIIGPINVERDKLNDWHAEERSVSVDRRWFMDVRDWITESSYDFYDPIREDALRVIRERERSEGKVMADKLKNEVIKLARISTGPQGKLIHLHKMQRIGEAWMRMQKARENDELYDPLQDDELFLHQRDFDLYYRDLAKMSCREEFHDKVPQFPFYENARKAILNDEKWNVHGDDGSSDQKYVEAMSDFFDSLSDKELKRLVNGSNEPYVNPNKNIGRNDPCPCGSGKKYKKCCGRDR